MDTFKDLVDHKKLEQVEEYLNQEESKAIIESDKNLPELHCQTSSESKYKLKFNETKN